MAYISFSFAKEYIVQNKLKQNLQHDLFEFSEFQETRGAEFMLKFVPDRFVENGGDHLAEDLNHDHVRRDFLVDLVGLEFQYM